MTRRRRLHLPDWWFWDIVLSPHVEQRMEERGFTEVDLRAMLQAPLGLEPSVHDGRFVVRCGHRDRSWAVVVEPWESEHLLVIVTAYQPG